MKFGSLFSGIGGFDLGFERAGMKCMWQVEIDNACNRTLEQHWPDARRHKDVREVGKQNLEPVVLICGGFPCQDVSVAGKRNGLAGQQSGLFFEFARIIAELAPKWVVIENVPGLLSSNGGRDMATVIGALEELGYGYAWRVLDAQYFGVAQRRRRVFIVGHLGASFSASAEMLFEPESLSRDPAPGRKAQEVAPTIFASGAGTSRPARIGSEAGFIVCLPAAHTITAREGQRLEPSAETFVLQGNMVGRADQHGPQGSGISRESCFTLTAADKHAVITL